MKLRSVLVSVVVGCLLQTPARPLTPQSVVVDSGSYRSFSFEVSKFGRVFGQFRTQAGKRSNIRVVVVNQDEFEDFRNGREVHFYYDSGRVSEGRIELQLRYGRYVLVFDNRSSFSSSTVESSLQLDEG